MPEKEPELKQKKEYICDFDFGVINEEFEKRNLPREALDIITRADKEAWKFSELMLVLGKEFRDYLQEIRQILRKARVKEQDEEEE